MSGWKTAAALKTPDTDVEFVAKGLDGWPPRFAQVGKGD
jgi:hypothetical protein